MGFIDGEWTEALLLPPVRSQYGTSSGSGKMASVCRSQATIVRGHSWNTVLAHGEVLERVAKKEESIGIYLKHGPIGRQGVILKYTPCAGPGCTEELWTARRLDRNYCSERCHINMETHRRRARAHRYYLKLRSRKQQR